MIFDKRKCSEMQILKLFQRFVSDKPHVVQDYLKKLRRRGKNKMAARNSRARKEDRVVTLEERVIKLKNIIFDRFFLE